VASSTLRSYVWAIGAATLVALLGCWLALQRPQPFDLYVGGNLTIGPDGQPEAPVYDLPYLSDVHDPEPADELLTITTTNRYRWTFPESRLIVPNLNGGASLARLRLAPPSVPSTPLTITINHERLVTNLPPGPRSLWLFAPASDDGTLAIDLDAPSYDLPPDPRPFGVALTQLSVQPAGWRPYLPGSLLLILGGVLLLLGAGGALAGLSPRTAGAITLILGLAMAVLLAATRETITVGADRLLTAALAGFAMVASVRQLGGGLAIRLSATQRELAMVAGLTGLGLALRLIGLRHPQANFSDLMLNVNNLTGVARGELFFPEGLTCEAGAGSSPYPPGLYVVLQPLLLLLDPSRHALALQFGGAALDALVIPMLWAGIRALDDSAWARRAALWSAALYLVPLAVLKSLIIGEYTNAAGQALALPALLGAIVWVGRGMPRRWRPAVLLALTLAALVHSGVLISLGLWGACWFVILLLRRRWAAAGQLALVGGAAVLLAGLAYYSAWIGDPRLASTNPECPVLRPLATKLGGVALDLLTLDGRVPVWFWLIGAGGLAASWRRLPALALPLAAWQGALLVSQVSLLWSEQTVRWWLFVTPALCLGGGMGLAGLAGRGRRSRWAAVGLTLMVLALSLGLWIRFIVRYRTGNFVP
jgi:hypothetical protein